MQSVTDAFSVEETDSVRKIAQSTQFAWKKEYNASIRIFTIGVSTIGGSDTINSSGGVNSDWNRYTYTDESEYVTRLSWERELNIPTGGLVKGLADIEVDNTSGRFNPDYLGGSSAIFTAVGLPRRPFIINAGFNYDGIDNEIPQFVGLTTKPPRINYRNKTVQFQGEDFMGFLQNQYVDDAVMFTGQRTDQVLTTMMETLGFSTSQYDFDYGVNVIGFGQWEVGDRFGDIADKMVKAENGHLYQDETGIIRFDNRQKWSMFPYFNVQRIISTGQVLSAETPNQDHLINVVEVKAKPRAKQPQQLVWKLPSYIEIDPNSTTQYFVNFNDPMLEVETPISTTNFIANTESDGSGADVTSSVSITSLDAFARAAKFVFTNSSSATAYITTLDIYGRPAKVAQEIYYRQQDSSSRTAYEEHIYLIENDYIQDTTWAESFSTMILRDYGEPGRLQRISIRAIPELQFGDLISWQGRYWRVYGIKSQLDPGVGFVQELDILQSTIYSYFRIGISTIGGSDQISA